MTEITKHQIGHIEKDAAEAHQVLEELEYLKHNIDVQFLQVAERLYTISERKWFLIYNNDTFEEFIDSVNMSRAWVYELMRIHKKYVLELGIGADRLADIGVTKLSVLAKDINSYNADDLLDTADSDISVQDLKREMGRAPEPRLGEPRAPIVASGYYHIMPADSINVVGDTLGKRVCEIIETDVGMVIKIG